MRCAGRDAHHGAHAARISSGRGRQRPHEDARRPCVSRSPALHSLQRLSEFVRQFSNGRRPRLWRRNVFRRHRRRLGSRYNNLAQRALQRTLHRLLALRAALSRANRYSLAQRVLRQRINRSKPSPTAQLFARLDHRCRSQSMHARRLETSFSATIDYFAKWGTRFPSMANSVDAGRAPSKRMRRFQATRQHRASARSMMEKWSNVDRRRTLPAFPKHTFVQRSGQHRGRRPARAARSKS